ncbi:MAG: ABC transporter permease [Bacillota bacterium]
MTLLKREEQPDGSVKFDNFKLLNVSWWKLRAVIYKSFVMIDMEVRKLSHDFTELLTRVIQPVLWLTIFGQAMSKARTIPTGKFTYLQFMTPGILAQSVVFIAIFYGISIIWERDLGVLQKFLVTPTPRLALVTGKMAAAGIRGISQAVIVIIVALLLRIQLHLSVLGALGVILIIILGAGFFAGLSMIIASIVKVRERFMGIGQLLTMPLFFASNAIYPIKIMPGWLQVIAGVNPLSYMVDALRSMILTNNFSQLLLDFVVMILATAIVAVIGSKQYPKVVI